VSRLEWIGDVIVNSHAGLLGSESIEIQLPAARRATEMP